VLRVGESVGGYDIVAKLRAGGMATLFLGKKHGAAGFTRHVAIKVVHEHLASDPDFVRMFVDEALLQARIQNPHVVHVEELGEADGAHFMVMEYVHGCALAQLLLALSKRKRRPQVEIAVSIALQTLAGLHAAHELRGDDGSSLGVVHRDVSPQNVLLSRDGHVKLIDFGVAKAASSLNQTQGAMIKGKIRYMPPEQAFGRPVDRRADLYALGIVLWEMLTMRKLFGAQDDIALLEMVRDPKIDPPSRWASEVPAALDRVVLKALSKDPADRYATAQEMRRALAEAVPAATMVEASSIAELLEASLGNELEKERKALPAAVGAQVGPSPDRTRVIEERAEEVLLTLTVSAAGLEVKSDIAPISGSMSDWARTSDPQISMSPALLPPGATPPPSPVSSVPVGTPSEVHGLTGPMMIGPLDLSLSPSTLPASPPRSRSFVPIAAVMALLVIALAGGGAYLWRTNTSDGMVASPLPVGARDTTGAMTAPISAPSVGTTPAPGSVVDGSDIAPRPAAIEVDVPSELEAAATTDPEPVAPVPEAEPVERTERDTPRPPRVRGTRRDRGEATGGAVPFSTEF
jgi:serine/threonine-protein kinase